MSDNEIPYEGLEQFVEKFLQDRNREFSTLKQSLLNKDYTTIKKMTHQWKGFCEPYGFGPLADLSILLETKAKEECYQDCEQLIEQIGKYLEKRTKAQS